MTMTAWVTLAALLFYFWTGLNVGRARGKYKVAAPATDGPEEFQRALRVQLNTLEQLALFLPALWMCAYFLADRWAATAGLAWVIGRILYALAYYKNPARRGLGFGITALAGMALMIGTAVGLLTR